MTRSHRPCGLSRRGLLGGGAVAGGAALTLPAWMPRVAFGAQGRPTRDVLVSIYLRGGADGLTLCVPHGDADLYVHRPTLAIQPPGSVDGAIDLDGFFGLPPAGAALLTPWNAGQLAFVHASGSPDPSRSHFAAQRLMETATPLQPGTNLATGWLGRHLAAAQPTGSGALRALGLGNILARTLVGGPATLPVPEPESFGFPGAPATAAAREAVLADVYALAQEPLRSAAEASFAAIDLLGTVDFAGYVPGGGAVYPLGNFGNRLRSSAALIKADVDVEALHIDLGGWDHHAAMGPLNGILANLIDELSRGLEAFYLDLGSEIEHVTVVVMTEFGRRIRENGSQGTDHGHGGCMIAMGGHIAGGQVLTDWPGIDASSGSGDMSITIDYRDILWEILSLRLGATALADIFPSFTPTPRGIIV